MRLSIFLILFLFSCSVEIPEKYNAGYEVSDDIHVPNNLYQRSAVHCLRDFITGEDAGGSWKIVSKPLGSILLQGDLSGTDNPCIDFANYGCGQYRLQYKVQAQCCADSTLVTINKRCCNVTASLSCN